MKVGILGGTFDPVHLGHLRLAEEVGEEFGLEKVYLIPAASPPHKGGKEITAFHHREAMARMAVEGSCLLVVSDLEGRRHGRSFSIETLKEVHLLYPTDLELFFILGTDAFLEIETWKEYRHLFDYAHFVVVTRPGIPAESTAAHLASLGIAFRKETERRYGGPSGNKVFFTDTTLLDISSTRIREKVAEGKSIRYLVPENVRCYILNNGLYGAHGTA